MIISKERQSNPNKITLGKVLVATAFSCVPYLSVSGELLGDTIKNHRVDKTPLKDSFIKAVEKDGKSVQGFFKGLKKFSPIKVGAVALTIGALIDFIFTYWCVDTVATRIKNKKK